MTKLDWRIINAALALYEAEDLEGTFGEAEAAANPACDPTNIENARRKVHERLEARSRIPRHPG